MRLRDLMSTEVVTIGPDADLVEAARLMRKQHVGFLIVIRPSARGEGVLAGVVTDRDIVLQAVAKDVDPHAVAVKDIMTTDVLTGKEDEGLVTVIGRMRKAGIQRVPVINAAHMVRGVISIHDVLRYLAELSEQLADTIRLSRRMEKRKRNA